MANELRAEVPAVATRSRRRLRAVPGPAPSDTDGPGPGEARGAGLPVAFDELYRAEWSAIVALGWSLTGSWPQAEELAQDAFADAYRRWAEVGRLERPGAWVRRAVINRSASYHRHRNVEQRGLERWSGRDGAGSDAASTDRTGDAAADHVGDPAFWAAMRSLPERQLACLALHYLEDRPVADIASILDCRPATVKVHLHRGRTALAERLAGLTPHRRTDGAPDDPGDLRPVTDEPGPTDRTPDHGTTDHRTTDDGTGEAR
jgi:RNA polymerase sigma-70 factor, ECF subfamily